MKPPGDDMLDALIDGRPEATPRAATSGFQLSEMMLLLMLASVQFTSIVDFMVVMPLGPQLKRLLGIDSSQFGLIVSSYTISAGIAAVFASTFMDRFGRKTAFLTLYAGFLAGTFLCGLAASYATLLAARVVTGAFGGILGGMALAIVGDVFPEHKRGQATGVLMSAFALASVVGVPVGIALGNRFDWHAPFLVLAGLGLPVFVAGLRILPELRDHLQAGPHAHPLTRLAETFSEPNHLRAFALVATMMLGGFAVIPYISVFLVGNLGVRETDLPVIYVTGRTPDTPGCADRRQAGRPVRKTAGLPRDRHHLGDPDARRDQSAAVALALIATATGTLMLSNAGRMVAAMAMVTGCVEPARRGGFMSANSAVQHISTGLGAYLGGRIIKDNADLTIRNFDKVGLMAVAATLVSLWLAGRVRPAAKPGPKPAEVSAFEEVLEDPLSAAESL